MAVTIQYSLRAVFLVVTLSAFGLSLWATNRHRQRRVERAIWELDARDISLRGTEDFTCVDIFSYDWAADQELRDHLDCFPPVVSLTLFDPALTDSQSEFLFSSTTLQTLILRDGELSEADFENLATGAVALEELEIKWCWLPTDHLERFPPTLRRLHLHYPSHTLEMGPEMFDEMIEVGPVSSLEELRICIPGTIHVRAMPHVKAMYLASGSHWLHLVGDIVVDVCPKLEALSLTFESPYDASDILLGIADQPSLAAVTIRLGPVNATDVRRLAGMPAIRALALEYTPITGEAIQALVEWQNLEELWVVGAYWADEFEDGNGAFAPTRTLPESVWSVVGAWPQLRTLGLHVPRALPHELIWLSTMKQLRLVPADEEAEAPRKFVWSVLSECPRLRTLGLHVEVTSPGVLASLTTMKRLRKLDLSGARALYNSSGVVALSDLPDLASLGFLEELAVGSVDLLEAECRAALPTTKIVDAVTRLPPMEKPTEVRGRKR